MRTTALDWLPRIALVVLSFWGIIPSSDAWMRATLSERLMGRAPNTPLIMRKAQTSNNGAATTKKNQRDMIEFMEQPVDSMTAEALSTHNRLPPEQDEVAELVRCIVQAADGRKAEDIVAMRVSHVSTLTTFLVILSGNSRPQNQAISAAIKKDVEEAFGLKPGGTGVPEGSPESGWMVLDYGSCMVHVMTPKSRLYYNVEGQWRDKGGEYMDLSNILIPNSSVAGSGESTGSNNHTLQAEDDPFWS